MMISHRINYTLGLLMLNAFPTYANSDICKGACTEENGNKVCTFTKIVHLFASELGK